MWKVLSGSTLLLAVLCAPARAELLITDGFGDPIDPEHYTIYLDKFSGGWNIVLSGLYAPGGETVYEIHGTGGEVVSTVLIDVPCWEDPEGDCMVAGSPVFVRVLSDAPDGITSIGMILQTGTAETFLLDVQANVDIGSIQAEVVGKVLAGRDVIGPVISTTPNHNGRGVYWVESGRDVLGDVITENGRIGLVWAHGNVGRIDDPVVIGAKHKINAVASDNEMYADINSRMNGGSGGLFLLGAARFVGSLEIDHVKNDVASGLPGRLVVSEHFEGTITIGESFSDPDQWIELPANGLSGQIIINVDAAPAANWSAPIYLGPEGDPDRILLDGPDYSEPANLLGGGSVGLVPFLLHDESCVPANGQTVQVNDAEPLAEIRLRHYGPVTWSAAPPVTIARREAGSTGGFTSLPPGQFEYLPTAGDPNSLRVRPVDPGGFQAGYEYRVLATASLHCNVPSLPAVAWDSAYLVVVEGPGCVADIDADGTVNILDLLAVLAAWGSAGGAEDVNSDGIVNILDLLDVLAAWGPCG